MLGIPGELMIRSLEGLVLPLIVFSVMSAIIQCLQTQSDHEDMEGGAGGGKGGMGIGWRALCYYMFTTSVSIAIGVTLTLIIHPGKNEKNPQNIFHISFPCVNKMPVFAVIRVCIAIRKGWVSRFFTPIYLTLYHLTTIFSPLHHLTPLSFHPDFNLL